MTEALWLIFGLILGVVLSHRRMSQVREQAQTDTLTGLYNRALLDKTLGRLMAAAERDKKSLSILMIDLNHFKEANDRFGHQFGDEVLKATSAEMVKALRKSDFICRYGGDEFMIILPEASRAGAKKVAEKLRDRLDRISLTTPKGSQFEDIGASIGVATYPEHAKVDIELIKRADEAVYAAKDKKGHIVVAS